jgi:hypothetical protein
MILCQDANVAGINRRLIIRISGNICIEQIFLDWRKYKLYKCKKIELSRRVILLAVLPVCTDNLRRSQ